MGQKKQKKFKMNSQPQLSRLHALIQRIQKGDYPNRTILGREWEKDRRTIQRDLDFIRDVWGLPLEYDQAFELSNFIEIVPWILGWGEYA
jgi:hypothetical protein